MGDKLLHEYPKEVMCAPAAHLISKPWGAWLSPSTTVMFLPTGAYHWAADAENENATRFTMQPAEPGEGVAGESGERS